MKTVTFLIILLTAFIGINAQDFSTLKEITLENANQFDEAKDQVIDCCYYLLGTPNDKKDTNRTYASKFVVRWMQGAPGYDFKIDDKIKQLTGENESLLSLYIVCFTQLILEDENPQENKDTIKKNALDTFVNYCTTPGNNIKSTKEIKKFKETQA